MRLAITSSITVTGRPFSSATRSRKRRLERDLAAHRAFGDGGDMRLEADEIGKFVDAFLTDHGGIHVGDQQHLAPMCQRLHHDVDFAVQCVAQPVGQRAQIGAGCRREGDVGRQIPVEPLRRARHRAAAPACAQAVRRQDPAYFGSAMKVATWVMRAEPAGKSAAYCRTRRVRQVSRAKSLRLRLPETAARCSDATA